MDFYNIDHCRIGSLETNSYSYTGNDEDHCRIGSLENQTD